MAILTLRSGGYGSATCHYAASSRRIVIAHCRSRVASALALLQDRPATRRLQWTSSATLGPCQMRFRPSTMQKDTDSYLLSFMHSPESSRQPLESELPEKIRLGTRLFRVAEAAARPIDDLFEQVSNGAPVSSSQLWQLAKLVRGTVFHQACEAAGLTEGEMDEALQQS
jgi:hypothetical protein